MGRKKNKTKCGVKCKIYIVTPGWLLAANPEKSREGPPSGGQDKKAKSPSNPNSRGVGTKYLK